MTDTERRFGVWVSSEDSDGKWLSDSNAGLACWLGTKEEATYECNIRRRLYGRMGILYEVKEQEK